jgi:glycosyltransferase involved in cell wall biosynthesis
MFGLAESDILIVVPSRIIERKGIREAITALTRLPSNFYLCLPSASNPLDTSYWQSITGSPVFAQVKDRVIIPTAEILHDKMPLLYAASDIVAMPSYYEGAPVATVEAMASKRPFVGADVQGINGFIRHEVNGLLVPQKSGDELAAAIKRLADNKVLRTRFASMAAKDVAHLSWKVQLPELIKLYRSCL